MVFEDLQRITVRIFISLTVLLTLFYIVQRCSIPSEEERKQQELIEKYRQLSEMV